MRAPVLILLLFISSNFGFPSTENDKWHPDLKPFEIAKQLEKELDPNYWRENAQKTVKTHSEQKSNKKIAKNIIFFMGDGMSVTTISAARSYLDTTMASSLTFEDFPYTGMAKNYCVNKQTADSACTATAYFTGVKTNYDMIGVTANVEFKDCEAGQVKENQTPSIAKWALDAGKGVGFVTTSPVTDASPVGLYGHTSNRNWECDVDVTKDGCDPSKTPDIAKQLIRGDVGSQLKVIMGGGRKEFRPNTTEDEEEKESYGRRQDGLDLIEEWKKAKGDKGTFVWNKKQLQNVDPTKTDFVLGLFEYGRMKYNLENVAEGDLLHEPSLSDMTSAALDILNNGKDEGFFLFVEGGLIDDAHHAAHANIALDETTELSKAVKVALSKVNLDETLIVVTADHAHTMSFSGYPTRTANILGTLGTKADDGFDQMILNYANGKGYELHYDEKTGKRVDPSTFTHHFKLPYPTTVHRSSETHGGEDVSVYAMGPWAHLFSGNYEQNAIAHFMAHAACIGPGTWTCMNEED
ncbi:membrane-bound alkaline phosphatase-like [Culicoides brevitarsis]|uniref:membrane-bound alkaline phosphatase-like n=1 Tax=Culicoides brevitarsis TaxID=469753 RepID=UPI00307BD8FC